MRFLPATCLFVILVGCIAQRTPSPSEARPAVTVGPWGEIDRDLPAESDLLEDIRDALDFRLREEYDRFLDAKDPSELREHAQLSQIAINRGIFGIDALFVFGDELFEYEFRPED